MSQCHLSSSRWRALPALSTSSTVAASIAAEQAQLRIFPFSGSLTHKSTSTSTRSLWRSLEKSQLWACLSSKSLRSQLRQQQKLPQESPALVAFWKSTSKMLHKSLRDTLANVKKLIEDKEAEAFFAAWEEDEPEAPPASSSQASGRLDGSDNSLQSGAGNLPLNLKLELARALGNFKP